MSLRQFVHSRFAAARSVQNFFSFFFFVVLILCGAADGIRTHDNQGHNLAS